MPCFVENVVDKFPQNSPQGDLVRLTGESTRSMPAAMFVIHIWGQKMFIHTIHRLYYYYDSLIHTY